MKKKIIILLSIFFPVLILDQSTKYIINNKISLVGKITIIKHYFNIVHVDNTGVAFGLMNSYSNIFIILLTSVIIAALVYFLFKTKINSNLLYISSSLKQNISKICSRFSRLSYLCLSLAEF